MEIKAFVAQMKRKQGSGLIASEAFLEELRKHASRLSRGSTVLDFCAGISTLTLFLRNLRPDLEVIAVEPDEWCRSEFVKNVGELGGGVVLLPALERLRDEQTFDLVLIDITHSDADVAIILDRAPEVIMIEGHRFDQRSQVLLAALSRGLTYSYKSFGGRGVSLKGGAVLRRKNATLFRRGKVRIQVLRIAMHQALKLHIIEWELSRAWLLAVAKIPEQFRPASSLASRDGD